MSFHFFVHILGDFFRTDVIEFPPYFALRATREAKNKQTVHLLQQETSEKRAYIFTRCQFQFPSLQNTHFVPESLFYPTMQFVIYHLRQT